jgi:hypothetical protein
MLWSGAGLARSTSPSPRDRTQRPALGGVAALVLWAGMCAGGSAGNRVMWWWACLRGEGVGRMLGR